MVKIEDIIDELKKLDSYCQILKHPDEYFVHMQGHRTELSLVLSAFDIAEYSKSIIEALEKQIPKKPNSVSHQPLKSVGWKYECPSCGCAVGENSNAYDYTQEDNYCPSCGQKLEW